MKELNFALIGQKIKEVRTGKRTLQPNQRHGPGKTGNPAPYRQSVIKFNKQQMAD
jgi:hypothetical protein